MGLYFSAPSQTTETNALRDQLAKVRAQLADALAEVFKYKQIVTFNSHALVPTDHQVITNGQVAHPGTRVCVDVNENGPFDFTLDGEPVYGTIRDGRFYFSTPTTGPKHTLSWQGQSLTWLSGTVPQLHSVVYDAAMHQLVIVGTSLGSLDSYRISIGTIAEDMVGYSVLEYSGTRIRLQLSQDPKETLRVQLVALDASYASSNIALFYATMPIIDVNA